MISDIGMELIAEFTELGMPDQDYVDVINSLLEERKQLITIAQAAEHGLDLGHWGEGSTRGWIEGALKAWKS